MMMDDDDDLFGELDVPAVVIENPYSNANKSADSAWAHWAKMTQRPQQRNPERDFIKAYKSLLADGHMHGRMQTVISGAARMPVRPRDPKDLRRVLYALQSPKGTLEALALLNEKDREVVPFPDSSLPVFKSTITDLEKSCRTNSADWTSADHEAAANLVHLYDAAELDKIADDTARERGVDAVLPTDMLRNTAAARSGAKSQTKHQVYDAGRTEEAKLEGINFAADNLADHMRRKGKSVAEIRKEHDKAPAGYWDAVIDVLLDDPLQSFNNVYDDLRKQFNWHPNSRITEKG
jgi:hypothetical protein